MSGILRSAFNHLRPLTLREWLYWRVESKLGPQGADAFKRAPLALAPGISLELEQSDMMHRIIAGTGVYGSPVSIRIARLAKRGGLFVDVGANYGYFSAIWAAGNPASNVIAFEALQSNADAMQRNMNANRLDLRVEIIEKAVGSSPGTMYFETGPEGQTGLGGLAAAGVHTSLQVEVVTLDEYFAGRADPIEVLKIDVEGADTLVLEGAETLLSRGLIKNIFFEFYGERMDYLGIPRSRAFDLLAKYGYQSSRVAKGEYYAKAP